MSKRKRRRGFLDFSDFFEFGFDEERLFEQEPIEGGSGYSMSVTYDEKGKPVVKVKTYGDVDVAELRKDIERQYPGAKIEGLEKQPLIRIVDEETKDEEQKSERQKVKSDKKEKKSSLIRWLNDLGF
ncbi:MAG: hypothetical protein ACE5OV_04190 [Candidatus Bathyarchaeia archaeon]